MPDGGAWDTGQPHEIVPLAQQPTAPVESLLDEDDFAVIREENDRSAASGPYTGQAGTKLPTSGDQRKIVAAQIGRWLRIERRRTSNGR